MVQKHSYYNSIFMLDEDRNDLHAYDIFDNNRIEILVAGYPTTVMIDSGASISVIDYNFLRKTCNKLPTKIDNILARRVMFLSQYDFNIIHKDGKTYIKRRFII